MDHFKMIKFRRKFCTVSTIVIIITTWYFIIKDKIYTANIFVWKSSNINALCCDITEDKLLSVVDEATFFPKNSSIFFHETSRKGTLDSRQACAVESAARIHRERDIYVIFSAPVTKELLETNSFLNLIKYSNVKLFRVSLLQYAQETPLEMLVTSPKLHNSVFLNEHTSDILRYITLYKWGGVYLDLDVIVVKCLDSLGVNWVGREDEMFANPAVMGISKDGLGLEFIGEIMRELKDTYDPQIFNYNGPGAVTRVLTRWCNSSDLDTWKASKCRGFPVYSPEYFFPIHFGDYKKYFQPGEIKDIIGDSSKVYTYHIWNKLSRNTTVQKHSPYAKLAREYCPEIFKVHRDKFGQ